MHKRLSERNVASVLTRRVAAIVACPAPSVTPVHEDVHERTGQEKEPWQGAPNARSRGNSRRSPETPSITRLAREAKKARDSSSWSLCSTLRSSRLS